MKHYLAIFLLCLVTGLFGQDLATECAANAGADRNICYRDAMALSAPTNLNYTVPPNIQWTYESGQLPANQVVIANPNDFNTAITNMSGSATWPIGDYYFKFCADCRDINEDGINDRPCDEVVITVKPDVTEPVITEPDGVQDGYIVACSQATFNVNALAPGETSSVSFLPDDNLLNYTINNGVVTVTRTSVNRKEACDYVATYTTSNGGCLKKVSVNIKFISPYDPNGDGIIEGQSSGCPTCSNKVFFNGDFPGCGGKGVWTGTGPGTVTPDYQNFEEGDAGFTVSQPGIYTFVYTVSNIAPCTTSTYTIVCQVFQIGSFSVGSWQSNSFCETTIPAGTYNHCFNQLNNALYTWTNNTPGITISDPHSNCSDIIVAPGVSLLNGPVNVFVSAIKYYRDYDCGGPLLPVEIPLIYSTYAENLAYINQLLQTPGICIESCKSTARVVFSGAPLVKIITEDVNFLCSNGSETVLLSNYFYVLNLRNNLQITVVDQPSGLGLPNMPYVVSANELLQLNVNGCGQYKFKIEATNYDYAVIPPTVCSSIGYLTINIEAPQQTTAGTDQVKCINEPIRLNANSPYCYAVGTWKQVNCNPCTITFSDEHDPNAQIFLNGLVPPANLEFEWSFESVNGDCDLSDITMVEVKDCITPCPSRISVVTTCVGDSIVLTAIDGNNNIIDASVYDVVWTPYGLTGNPVTVLYVPPVNYTVEVTLFINDEKICFASVSGTANCVQTPQGCGAKVIERCDDCGNIILTLVDANTGEVIIPTTYEHTIRWVVFGGGANDPNGIPHPQENPIVIQQDACYTLKYEHYYYRDNVPHVPGYQDSICVFNLPKTCVSIRCDGPCSDFNDFFIAGCGDDLDVMLNLTFPGGCYNVCNAYTTAGTLGVFHTSTGLPVDPLLYNIVWKNGATGTYVSGQMISINQVTITQKGQTCCKWADRYAPSCMCSNDPAYIQCQQPIVKYCPPEGPSYYIYGAPEITWAGVSGATSYVLEVTTGSIEECCTGSDVPQVQTYTVTSAVWVIPAGLHCFSIRIKAFSTTSPFCPETDWSETYNYCPERVTCNPVITVCGCCGGERTAEETGLPTTIVPEEELLAYLKANPGTEYPTLRDAMIAAGLPVANEVDFSVFPNPANDQIVIQAGNSVKGAFKVQVTDLLQREWRKEAFDAAGQYTLNISDLPNGIYLVTIRNAQGDRMMTEKIIVLK